jgi:hypothetical protein
MFNFVFSVLLFIFVVFLVTQAFATECVTWCDDYACYTQCF